MGKNLKNIYPNLNYTTRLVQNKCINKHVGRFLYFLF